MDVSFLDGDDDLPSPSRPVSSHASAAPPDLPADSEESLDPPIVVPERRRHVSVKAVRQRESEGVAATEEQHPPPALPDRPPVPDDGMPANAEGEAPLSVEEIRQSMMEGEAAHFIRQPEPTVSSHLARPPEAEAVNGDALPHATAGLSILDQAIRDSHIDAYETGSVPSPHPAGLPAQTVREDLHSGPSVILAHPRPGKRAPGENPQPVNGSLPITPKRDPAEGDDPSATGGRTASGAVRDLISLSGGSTQRSSTVGSRRGDHGAVASRAEATGNGPRVIDNDLLLRTTIHDYVNYLIDVNHGKICVPQTMEFGAIGGRGWNDYDPTYPPSFEEYQLVISPVPSPNDFPTKQFKQVCVKRGRWDTGQFIFWFQVVSLASKVIPVQNCPLSHPRSSFLPFCKIPVSFFSRSGFARGLGPTRPRRRRSGASGSLVQFGRHGRRGASRRPVRVA